MNLEQQAGPFENDPFVFTEADAKEFGPQPGLVSAAKDAINKGFHVFPLTPKDKIPLPSSQGFKDSKSPDDAGVLTPWNEDPNRNIGINLGASDLCVLDFDKPESIPAWLDDIKTFRVRTAKGVHIYFRGARRTTKLFVDGTNVGDVKSDGGYVLAAGSIHPSGAVYSVIDSSEIAALPERFNELIRHESTQVNASTDGPPIPYGSHDTELTRIAGVLRNASLTPDEIEEHLVRVCERRCVAYGSDYKEMCHKIAQSIGKKPVGQFSGLLFETPNPQQMQPNEWRSSFKTLGELEQGDVRMLINDFLPEGTIYIGGLPGEGKTLFALSIARALTTGKPFLNKFVVPQTVPVIYLIPESGGRAFRKRCEKFQIPDDPDKFLCRTVSEGSTLPLDDGSLLEAVRRLRPVIILDTIIRFSEAEDENQAMQNKALVDNVIRLRQAGAVAVIGLHHATKAMRKDGMSLETALRGTGDIAASADAVYGLLRDNMLYGNGEGPNEVEVACLKPRDFDPPAPFRIASTTKPAKQGGEFLLGMESLIDKNHDFTMVSRGAQADELAQRIGRLVEDTPTITIKGLTERTGRSEWEVRKSLSGLGYTRSRGGKKGATQWVKGPVAEENKAELEPEPDISLDMPLAA